MGKPEQDYHDQRQSQYDPQHTTPPVTGFVEELPSPEGVEDNADQEDPVSVEHPPLGSLFLGRPASGHHHARRAYNNH
ncbi:MAG: hypothetical protein QGF78_05005 [Candidatus Bathyarchaeota archaeon]|nr:hypothetical protein [Candidatus Bathyarchaeota archaeon]